MSWQHIADLGPGPANEPCAQLGRTPGFDGLNRLELDVYQAAIRALNPPIPDGMRFAQHANHHDFGTYRTLTLETDPARYSADLAHIAAERLLLPLTWLSAGFRAPVDYTNPTDPKARHLNTCVASALSITRPRDDGSFFPPENEMIHKRLRAAYPSLMHPNETPDQES